jgi:phage FluMu protein Com
MINKLRCDCGKWLARLDDNGDIFVWCKNCKKEVKLTPTKPVRHKDNKSEVVDSE